jgi:hypothetical protein
MLISKGTEDGLLFSISGECADGHSSGEVHPRSDEKKQGESRIGVCDNSEPVCVFSALHSGFCMVHCTSGIRGFCGDIYNGG